MGIAAGAGRILLGTGAGIALLLMTLVTTLQRLLPKRSDSDADGTTQSPNRRGTIDHDPDGR